ncbi:MAG: MoaD/ThiS family protein [Promethearchaeota archaeon]
MNMPLQVYLYGDLLEKAKEKKERNTPPLKFNIDKNEKKTVSDVLKEFGITENEISHIFVNGKYCGPGKEIKDGDRIGIFPRRMGLNFIEIATNNTIPITVKFFATLQKYGPPKAFMLVPEGSTVNTILKKYNIPLDKENVKIMVNGIPHISPDYILKKNDVVAIFPLLAGG